MRGTVSHRRLTSSSTLSRLRLPTRGSPTMYPKSLWSQKKPRSGLTSDALDQCSMVCRSQTSTILCEGSEARNELITGICSSASSGANAKNPEAAAAGSQSSSGRLHSIVESTQTPPYRPNSTSLSKSLSAAGGIQKPPYFSSGFMALRSLSYLGSNSPRRAGRSAREMRRISQPKLYNSQDSMQRLCSSGAFDQPSNHNSQITRGILR
mmetsp:Transcript_26374/g.87428  ORF Transcript_26374/g.87428 Transcript_26374/m.87428 type:complete len:209 (+) Transcript_26374:412-1038(+)